MADHKENAAEKPEIQALIKAVEEEYLKEY